MKATALAETLRRARTAAYWLASPIDRIGLQLTDRLQLPPLWLRRHTGAVAYFESAAQETAQFIDQLELVRQGDTVLDIGCGPGAMVPEFAARIGKNGRYVGFDFHAPSIRWCRRHHAGDPRLAFEQATSASGSGPESLGVSYRFPCLDGEADFVLAKSVFTHLLEPVARHYLSEIRRTLRPGRAALATAFLFENREPALSAVRRSFPWSGPGESVRWRRQLRPVSAVAYESAFFGRMVEAAGLRVHWLSAGFFPGHEKLLGQDTVFLGH